jgi:hypothetical protein
MLAAVFGVATQCDVGALLGGGSASEAERGRTVDGGPKPPPPPPDQPGQPAEQDLTEAFRAFVMIDRSREPDWFAQLTRVTFAENGALTAQTSLPRDWRDESGRTRPAESICTQLFAYAQRGAKRAWTTIAVLADDGTALVTRTGAAASCRQS